MNQNMDSWQVGYPDGLIKTIDYFRKKYFQYDVLDAVIAKYIQTHCKSLGKRVCSLGSGTGRHEVELAKLGYEVIGLERNKESVEISKKYIEACGAKVAIYECDFLVKEDVDKIMSEVSAVDICALLLIPISISDYSRAAQNMSSWILEGGLFIADNFGYLEGCRSDAFQMTHNVEVAESPDGKDFAVRLNYYEYRGDLINWDAVYLYNENGQLRMMRDHDILDIVPEERSDTCLSLNNNDFEILPNYRIVECEDGLAPPHLYEYIIGRRKYFGR